ncbi:hypothetical protein AX15_006800 [Amanita polypyramis BW_CC]|nr:hypothetical protein AX15_006800 [Amanita polypyramis BW_CC]
MSANAAQSSQQSPRQRKPPFSNYPTIKILIPPQGKLSPKTDEWCFTYCSQSVTGRIHGKEPHCRSICVRKVFPHEVRNIPHFKSHRNIGPDGKTKYPLPDEGQPDNIPKLLGGRKGDDQDGAGGQKPEDIKYWDEGWYMWTGKGRWIAHERTGKMMLDLEHQHRLETIKGKKRKEATAEAGNKQSNEQSKMEGPPPPRKWGYVVPRYHSSELVSESLLLPLPPEFPPFWDRISKLLAPTFHVLGTLHQSIVSGEQRKFATRVWEKAWTDEPFILASRTFTRAYERWKENEEERKRDST